MVIVVGAFLLYQGALDRPWWQRFAIAGATVGAAASFKLTGAYVFVSVLLCWLIIRRPRPLRPARRGRRGDRGLPDRDDPRVRPARAPVVHRPSCAGPAGAGVAEVRRDTDVGWQPGPPAHRRVQVLHPSLLLGAAGIVIAGWRGWQCYRARDWQPARPNGLLFAWLATGVVVFGFSSLKFRSTSS